MISLIIELPIDTSLIKNALNEGKKNGVLKRQVADQLGITLHQLGNFTRGDTQSIPLEYILKIEKITHVQILPTTFQVNGIQIVRSLSPQPG